MKTLFLMLFFGKSVLLTLEPVNLSHTWLELTPSKPISAINGGAALHVDVTQETGFITSFDTLEKIIPKDTVTAELIPESGQPIAISNHAIGHGKDNVFLILSHIHSGMPTDIKFKKIRIRSTKQLKQVKVRWRNYSL